MAGNVKEWVWNASDDRRYILGGAWSEPTYMFYDADARSPWDRQATHGFRLMQYESRVDDVKNAPYKMPYYPPKRDFDTEQPVPDDVFRLYARMYSYDRTPLNAVTESVDSMPDWTREEVSFDAAYGGERVTAFLFLPKRSSPPYQTVVYFPGSGAIQARANGDIQFERIDFIVQSGRAAVFPIYKGTYERGDALSSDIQDTTSSYRDHVIMWVKDLTRSIDYLETREDINTAELGYYGSSWGAFVAPIMLALEKRLRVGVLRGGGFGLRRSLPEADPFNYAPRVNVPILMLNGRYDYYLPVETSQSAMYRMFATREPDKRHVLYETGHFVPRVKRITETLDWLDRYLGPVN
jgi:dienelactone hydrolase